MNSCTYRRVALIYADVRSAGGTYRVSLMSTSDHRVPISSEARTNVSVLNCNARRVRSAPRQLAMNFNSVDNSFWSMPGHLRRVRGLHHFARLDGGDRIAGRAAFRHRVAHELAAGLPDPLGLIGSAIVHRSIPGLAPNGRAT